MKNSEPQIFCKYDRLVDSDELKAHPDNAHRSHPEKQLDRYEAVIRGNGWRKAVVVSKRSGFIVKGHGAWLTAARAGWSIPVEEQQYESLAEERRDLLADNQLALDAVTDDQKLAQLLSEMAGPDLELTGFNPAEIENLLAELNVNEVDAEPQIDKAAELQKKWGIKRGQVWELGAHRLMCGDCRDSKDVRKLITSSINIAFTSPPYAAQRDYDESSGFKPIPPDDYVAWFDPVQSNIKKHLANDGSWFMNIKPSCEGLDTVLYVFDLVIAHARRWKWHFVTEFCWERSGIPKSVKRRFKNQFEPIYHFSRGEFKMRPNAVMHHSDAVPIPRGSGAGNTSWKKEQGRESIFMSGHQGEGRHRRHA